jgi:ligand-binding sensor domain-containing protein
MRYCTVIFLFLVHASSAQPVFKNYNVSDGLVSNFVRRIYQDSKGFLWIATWEGLSRYDGHQFINYNASTGLSNNVINDFYESGDGTMYVATNGGGLDIIAGTKSLPKAVPSTGIVNRFLRSPSRPIIAATDAEGLLELRNGQLLKPAQPSPGYSYNGIAWLNDSLMIAMSNYAIQVLDGSFRLYAEYKRPNTSFFDTVIYKDSKNRIWKGSDNGLSLVSLPGRRNYPISTAPVPPEFYLPVLRNNRINDIFEDAHGTTWIATNGGLVRLYSDGSNQLFTTSQGLPSNNVTCIYQDREKNIWVGTSAGLSKLVTYSDIRLYNTQNGLLSDNVNFIFPIGKYVLTEGSRGAQLFNTETGQFTNVANNRRIFLVNKMGRVDTMSLRGHANIRAINYQSCIRLLDGTVVAGNEMGLYVLDNSFRKSQIILKRRIAALLLDQHGRLWAGTWNDGLYRLQFGPAGDTLEVVALQHFLPGQFIRSLFQDSGGNIWAGSRYNGIYRLDWDNAFSVMNLSQSSGLTSDWIASIVEDLKGNVWLGSYMGLDKLIKRDSGYAVFNFGRINNYFTNLSSMCVDDRNRLWLATKDGMAQIQDGEMENLPPLPVYISKIRSGDSVYSSDSGKISLDFHHNQIQFEFSSPGFINEKEIEYSYRLTGGAGSNWFEIGNQHILSFANLQPGEYLFEVRTRGWNGHLGQPAAFSFTIAPPFWQTTWFKVMVCSILAGLIYFFVRRRIRSIRHESELRQKIAETEMMALRAQMNPHFIFNSLNSIDNLIQSNQKEKATIYFSRFARLIRSILENSRHDTIPCWKDMETLELYLELENLRWDKRFTSEIRIDECIQDGDYKVPPMVIQPYVENAIQHGLLNKDGSDCHLKIEVRPVDKYIKYIIEDNGVGRKKAGEYKLLNKPRHTSMGMQLTEKRIQLFNKNENGSVKIVDLYHADQSPAGTRVEVFINNNV